MRRLMMLCVAIASVVLFASCASQRWVDVSDSIDVENLMQQKFPALYESYKSGELIVSKVEQRTDKHGDIRYRVTHKDRHSDDSDEELLWQTVYMPLLNE